MRSVVRSAFVATMLLAGASAAMAAPNNPPVVGQTVQTGASTATTASNAVPLQPVQTTASTASVPGADQPQKTSRSSVSDLTDPYGGHDPNSPQGIRAFWEDRNQY